MVLWKVLFEFLGEGVEGHDLVAGGTGSCLDLDESFAHGPQVVRVALGNPREVAFEHFLVKALHVFSRERRLKGYHLVEHASKRPDVALHVIGFITPHLRASIVGRSSLCVIKTPLVSYFGHVHVAQFSRKVFVEEHVGALEVTVHHIKVMHSFEPAYNLDEDAPNLLFGEGSLVALVL